jgi:hypothetical protein
MKLLDGRDLIALPHQELRTLLKKYGRLNPEQDHTVR